MATAYTQYSGTQPYAYLTFTGTSYADRMVYSWSLRYHADYAISTSSSKRISAWMRSTSDGGSWRDLAAVDYSINGKTGTHTVASGTLVVDRTHSQQTVEGYVRIEFGGVVYSGVTLGTRNGTASVTIGAKTSYTVSYNANGGLWSGSAPSNQTKWYGESLALASSVPTRSGYNFLGWGTSADATTPSYQAGDTFTGNYALALYAVWELALVAPRLSGLQAYHSDGQGAPSTEGTYLDVKATLVCANVSGSYVDTEYKVYVGQGSDTPTLVGTYTVQASSSGVSNNIAQRYSGANPEKSYSVKVVATYGDFTAAMQTTVTGKLITVDFARGGNGIGIGTEAPTYPNSGLNIAFDTNHTGKLQVNNYDVLTTFSVPDFIIAEGTETTGAQGSQTSWSWTIWYSGKCECWGKGPSTTVSSWTLWANNLYNSTSKLGGAAYPTDFFASAPFFATAEFISTSSDALWNQTEVATASTAPKIYLYKPLTTNTTGYVQYYAKGTVSSSFPYTPSGGAIPDGDNMEYGTEE